MAANIHLGHIDVRDDGYAPLSSKPLVGTVTLVVHPSNDNPVNLRAGGDPPVQLPKGRSLQLRGVDISTLQASGATWDRLLFAGFTR